MTATASPPGAPVETSEDLQAALFAELDGEVEFDAHTRHLSSTDAGMYAIDPLGVVTPRHAGDVAIVVVG